MLKMKKSGKLVSALLLSATMTVSGTSVPAYAAGPGAQTDKSVTDHELKSAKNSLKLAEEGLVLLQNRKNVLPLAKKSKVALYGLGAVRTIKGGTGSGAVNNRIVYPDGTSKDGESIAVSIEEGLEREGFTVTNKTWLNNEANAHPETAAAGMFSSNLATDAAISTEQMTADAKEAEIGIYVIRRNAGEGADRHKTKGDWYLTDEEKANIELMSKTFKKSIVLLNVVSIDSTWIKGMKNLDSVMLIGNPGELGGIAVARNLNGTVNPSGHLVDTWADIEDYPSTKYFASEDKDDPYGSKVEYYGEGIYTGYRYFDKFAANKVIYDFGYGLSYTKFKIATKDVKIKNGYVNVKVKVTNTGKKYSGKEVVQVYFSAPTGKGKLDKPYQELAAFGKTDTLKPGKSQELTLKFKANEMSSYDEKTASYIMDSGNYVIRVGNRSAKTTPVAKIKLDKKVVTEKLTNQLTMDSEGTAVGGSNFGGQYKMPYLSALDISVAQGKKNYASAEARFKEFAGVNKKSRANAKKDKAVKKVVKLGYKAVENINNIAYKNGNNEDVTTYVSQTTPKEGQEVNGFNYQTNNSYNTKTKKFDGDYSKNTLKDVYEGKITMEQFVSGMTINELANMVEGGNKSSKPAGQSAGGLSPDTLKVSAADDTAILKAYVPGEAGETNGLYIGSKLIPNTTNADGPAGLRVNQSFEEDGKTYYQFATAYPAGQNNAQTWNLIAEYDEGVSIGKDMKNAGVDVWLAPGMNIHRNPLCGRNFEYFSEDPLLTGAMGAALTKGVQSIPGRGTTIKHFALNNQETERNSSNSVVSERALREIYLKNFEIAVKEAQPMCVMSSYNSINNVPASDNYDLLENILRKEWGYQGMVMTDWGGAGGSSDARSMHAGNDIIMAGHEVSEHITSYISDAAPTWSDNGYPFTKGSTMTFGTFVFAQAYALWGDYRPSSQGSITFTRETTKDKFDKKNVTVTSGRSIILDISAREAVERLKAEGAAEYKEDGNKVTITYKLRRASNDDNRSTQVAMEAIKASEGKQNPVMSPVSGKVDDYNTLTLADLQKSNIRILNMVMRTGNFYKLIGVEGKSYGKEMKDGKFTTVIMNCSKGKVK